MKLVSLITLLVLSISCGNDRGGSSSGKAGNGICNLNGRSIACESIQGADGLGIDLLEAMIDVPIKVENADITFLADKSATSTGRRINCKVSVKNGEIYRFALRGAGLLLMTPEGSYEMTKLNDGEGLNGTWTWNGYIDQGTHVIRNLTIIGGTRAVMRTHCEL